MDLSRLTHKGPVLRARKVRRVPPEHRDRKEVSALKVRQDHKVPLVHRATKVLLDHREPLALKDRREIRARRVRKVQLARRGRQARRALPGQPGHKEPKAILE
jgi:hypothetical protein